VRKVPKALHIFFGSAMDPLELLVRHEATRGGGITNA
jgi:hypothetical protein